MTDKQVYKYLSRYPDKIGQIFQTDIKLFDDNVQEMLLKDGVRVNASVILMYLRRGLKIDFTQEFKYYLINRGSKFIQYLNPLTQQMIDIALDKNPIYILDKFQDNKQLQLKFLKNFYNYLILKRLPRSYQGLQLYYNNETTRNNIQIIDYHYNTFIDNPSQQMIKYYKLIKNYGNEKS